MFYVQGFFDAIEILQLRFGTKEIGNRLPKGETIITGRLQALIPSALILSVTPITTSRFLPFDLVHNLTSTAERAFSASATHFPNEVEGGAFGGCHTSGGFRCL